jgi:hypothetical protein
MLGLVIVLLQFVESTAIVITAVLHLVVVVLQLDDVLLQFVESMHKTPKIKVEKCTSPIINQSEPLNLA